MTARLTRFRIEASRSTLRFDAEATGPNVHGLTHVMQGVAIFDPEDLSHGAEVDLRVEAGSLKTGNGMRDRKMRGACLESGRFPSIAFRSSSIRAITPTLRPGESQEMMVEGTLSLHGVDRFLRFPVVAKREGEDLRVTGGATVRMQDFSISPPRFLFLKVQDEIKVMFDIVAVPEAGTGRS